MRFFPSVNEISSGATCRPCCGGERGDAGAITNKQRSKQQTEIKILRPRPIRVPEAGERVGWMKTAARFGTPSRTFECGRYMTVARESEQWRPECAVVLLALWPPISYTVIHLPIPKRMSLENFERLEPVLFTNATPTALPASNSSAAPSRAPTLGT